LGKRKKTKNHFTALLEYMQPEKKSCACHSLAPRRLVIKRRQTQVEHHLDMQKPYQRNHVLSSHGSLLGLTKRKEASRMQRRVKTTKRMCGRPSLASFAPPPPYIPQYTAPHTSQEPL